MRKIEEMVKLQLVANVQYEKTGKVEPETMAKIEALTEGFDIFDHMLVISMLNEHFDIVDIQVVK